MRYGTCCTTFSFSFCVSLKFALLLFFFFSFFFFFFFDQLFSPASNSVDSCLVGVSRHFASSLKSGRREAMKQKIFFPIVALFGGESVFGL